jgi:hypothetical protein
MRAIARVMSLAPVLGNPDFAKARKLFVLAAGPHSALEKVRPLLERHRKPHRREHGTDLQGREGERIGSVYLAALFLSDRQRLEVQRTARD